MMRDKHHVRRPGRRKLGVFSILAFATSIYMVSTIGVWLGLDQGNDEESSKVRAVLAGFLASLPSPATNYNVPAAAMNKYRPVSCPDIMERLKDEDFYDPNKDMVESPKRHTITDPPFWISLHKEWFDKMRWNSIMKKGEYYETGLTQVVKEILTNSTISPGLVLDAGMNIGWFTLWSRQHGHSVAAFEPNPIMHVRVCESLALNGWDTDASVRIYPYGLANEERVMDLTIGKNPGGSSFHEERLVKAFRKSISVDVVKIDNVAEQEGWLDDVSEGPPIHLMKIDVEGYENFVVLGGTKLIQSGRVSNIIVENSLTDEAHIIPFLDAIYQGGYQVHSLLSVNGDPIDAVNMADLNEEISLIPSRDSAITYDQRKDPSIQYFFTHTTNMWWVKR
jgi:FkbM family methyltransferase